MRLAKPDDAAELESFLSGFPETTMFLRSNLTLYGVGQHCITEGASQSSDFWIDERDGSIAAVLAISKAGWVMAQVARGVSLDHDRVGTALAGRDVLGFNGDAAIIRPLVVGLGLERSDFLLLDDDVLYALDLDHLVCPDLPGVSVHKALRDDMDQIVAWRAEFEMEALSTPEELAHIRAKDSADRLIERGWSYILRDDGAPVSMAGFNAKVADLGQLGSVFTPKDLRGRGYGGAVVGQMLKEARAQGMTRAILFAATAEAGRVYERLGFRPVGRYTLANFAQARRLR